jgi:uncharacterized protein YydD (DUF2326 family)
MSTTNYTSGWPIFRHERDKLVEALRQRREIDNTDDEIATERRQVISHGRRAHDEREAVRARAIELFNSNSRALYGEGSHGTLEIAFTNRGSFSFNVDIQGEGSQGIEKMKLFCFDLMLAQLWADRDTTPGFVFHDSHIFDGVDDRQKAAALRLAAQQAEEHGFQYICSFNSNDLPWSGLAWGARPDGSHTVDPYRRWPPRQAPRSRFLT